MKAKARRIDYFPDEMIAGIAGRMDALDFGVYWMVCTLIYSRGGPIDDDHVWIANLFRGTHWRVVRASLDRLIAADKVVQEGGKLMVRRCADELQKVGKRIAEATQNGRKGGRPSNKNNDVTEPDGFGDEKLTTNHQPATTKEDANASLSAEPTLDLAPAEPDDVQQAFDAYNATAQTAELPKAQVLNTTRRASLKRRLKECGGLEGWAEALRKLEASSHCRGNNDRGWRADLDFLLQAQSFTRLMEGRYDDRKPQQPHRQQQTTGRVASTAERRERLLHAAFGEMDPGGGNPG